MQNEHSLPPSYKSGYHGDIPATVASVSFFLLFPGFLFYHQFVAMGLIPPFAGGLFGYVSLGALLTLLALTPWHTGWLKTAIRQRYTQWTLAFLVYVSVWTLAHYLLFKGEHISIASAQSLETVILWSSLFLTGLLLPIKSRPLCWSLCISFVVILTYLLYFYASTGASMYNAWQIYGNTTDVSTYQGFGRSVLFTLLALLAILNSLRARAVFIIGGIFVLYMLISRSDFYAFLALSVTLCLIYGTKQPKYFLLLLVICLEVLLLAAPDITPRIGTFLEARAPEKAEPTPDANKLPDDGAATIPAPANGQTSTLPADDTPKPLPRISRQFEVLDFADSKSWAGRLTLQRKAMEQIAENPLMGKFGGHVLMEDTDRFEKGHAGRYAHNALSAWVSYGLAGFLMYVSLTLFGVVVCARQVILNRQNDPLWMFAFMVNFVSLLLIIVSKSVFWPLPALGWGMLAQKLAHPAIEHD